MIEKYDVDLSKYVTFHVGGIAKKFLIPENEIELKEVIESIQERNEIILVLSGGSNLLINDCKKFESVIHMSKIDNRIIQLDNGKFYFGASNRIQKVITEVNKLGYGGFEEFIGLPAMIGGMIYMNAGIGGEKNSRFTIGDFVTRVRVYDVETNEYRWIDSEKCEFGHRRSIFQNGQYIIVGAEFQLQHQDIEISNERIKKRRLYCREHMEFGKGCFGTLFSKCSGRLVKVVALLDYKKKNVKQGNIKANWLINCGNGTYKEAMSIILKCERLHKLFGKPIEREVQIWE